MREGIREHRECGDWRYKGKHKSWIDYAEDRGSQEVQAYNKICSRTTPADVMCKNVKRHFVVSKDERELV